MPKKIDIFLPDWTDCLPGHAMIEYKDLVKSYGCNPSSIEKLVASGRLPVANHTIPRIGKRTPKHAWKLSELREFFNGQNSDG